MCGIAGILDFSGQHAEEARLECMLDQMVTRGPDAEGRWAGAGGRVLLGHRRLAIIDLDARASQPMHHSTERFTIVFNGEIYNYRALRARLENDGARFRTSSDTEVVLELFARFGKNALHELRGMYALAIWDAETCELFLARDPYGIKPLYFAHNKNEVVFASQVKALVQAGVSCEVDPAGVVGFFLWGNIPEPFTYLRNVRALPAGTMMTIGADGSVREATFARLGDAFDRSCITCPDPEIVREALLDSVRHHLVADVPAGLFLSAGVDSSVLLGLMHEAGSAPVQTITLAFEEFSGTADDESQIAAEVARHYGAEHATITITETEFRKDIIDVLDIMDQPSVDGINTYFVSKAAHLRGLKVALSGAGGDELFGGYATFSTVPRDHRIVSAGQRLGLLRTPKTIKQITRQPLLGKIRSLDPKLGDLLRFGGTMAGAYLARRALMGPSELTGILDPDFVQAGLEQLEPFTTTGALLPTNDNSSFAAVSTLESSLYLRNQLLRDADWASMAHSLEVRVPLIDSVLLSQVAPHLSARAAIDKTWLAQSVRPSLPASVLARRKTGFSTPINYWLTRDDRLDAWRRAPRLAAPETKWAKRWAYVVASHFGVLP